MKRRSAPPVISRTRTLLICCGIHTAGLAGPDDLDAADGWEHIERPNWGVVAPGLDSRGVAVPAAVLPPPPTEPELIEQWTRAMFTDHVGPRDGAQQQVSCLASGRCLPRNHSFSATCRACQASWPGAVLSRCTDAVITLPRLFCLFRLVVSLIGCRLAWSSCSTRAG